MSILSDLHEIIEPRDLGEIAEAMQMKAKQFHAII